MVFYGITLIHLVEDLQAEYPRLLVPFYAYYIAFDILAGRSATVMEILLEKGPDKGYFSDPSKSLFISDLPDQEADSRKYIYA